MELPLSSNSRKSSRKSSRKLRDRSPPQQTTRDPLVLPIQDKYAGQSPVTLNWISNLSNDLSSNCGTTRTPLWRRAPDGQTICNACGLYLKARNIQRPLNLKRPLHGTTLNTTQTGAGATYVAADAGDGTCPGGGRCNGTGGAEGCSGCPAYNNRVAKSAQLTVNSTGAGSSSASVCPANSPPPSASDASLDLTSTNTTVVVACQNCGTTITPLWRRDVLGSTICNACGKCKICNSFTFVCV